MARLGLKVFYLRTRERKLTQQAVAEAVGVRQATLSYIEQGVSLPSAALLVELSRFYDVTPTYLLDEQRGVIPLPPERWSLRNALVTVDMWVEAPADEIVTLANGKVLCPMAPGVRFYDDDAARVRKEMGKSTRSKKLTRLLEEREKEERELERNLSRELKMHPQRRDKLSG